MSFEVCARQWVDGKIRCTNLLLKGIGGLGLDHLKSLGFQGNHVQGNGGFNAANVVQGGIVSVEKLIKGGGGEFEVIFSKCSGNAQVSVRANSEGVKIKFTGNDGTVSAVKFCNGTGGITVRSSCRSTSFSVSGKFDPEKPLDNPNLFMALYNTLNGFFSCCMLSFGPLVHGQPGGLTLDMWKHKRSAFDPSIFGIAPLPEDIGNTKFKDIERQVKSEVESILGNEMLSLEIFTGGMSGNRDPLVDLSSVLSAVSMCQEGKAVNFKGVYPTCNQIYRERIKSIEKDRKSGAHRRDLCESSLSVSLQDLSLDVTPLPLPRNITGEKGTKGSHRRRHLQDGDYISAPLPTAAPVGNPEEVAAALAYGVDAAAGSSSSELPSTSGLSGNSRGLASGRHGNSSRSKPSAPKQQRLR